MCLLDLPFLREWRSPLAGDEDDALNGDVTSTTASAGDCAVWYDSRRGEGEGDPRARSSCIMAPTAVRR